MNFFKGVAWREFVLRLATPTPAKKGKKAALRKRAREVIEEERGVFTISESEKRNESSFEDEVFPQKENNNENEGCVVLSAELSSLSSHDRLAISKKLANAADGQIEIFNSLIKAGCANGTIKILPAFAKAMADRAAMGALSQSSANVDSDEGSWLSGIKTALAEGQRILVDGVVVDARCFPHLTSMGSFAIFSSSKRKAARLSWQRPDEHVFSHRSPSFVKWVERMK